VQSGTAITVVAGENFWGSIAAQLGGSKVTVQSVVTDPNADPHEYESSSSDARAFAEARLVILNGAGYDSWGQKLLDANKATNRRVLNIAALLGKKQGDNPHFWYDPSYVTRIADEIVHLQWIFRIVEEQPRPIQVPHKRVTCGPHTPVFLSALAPLPFTKRRRT